MSQHIQKQGLLLLVAVLIGLIAGGVTTLFGQVLLAIGEFRASHLGYLLPFLGLAGLLIVFLYQTWGKQAQKGMALVFEAGQGQQENIPKRLIPLIMLTTWMTHVFGGSAGREGVAVQIGATIGYQVQHYFSEKFDSKQLVMIGMAAGFAGLFQTPLAAAFFAIEVLVVGQYAWAILPASLLAAYVASTTSHLLGLEKFQHLLTHSASLPLTAMALFKLILLSLAFAAIGNLFAIFLKQCKASFAKTWTNPYWRIFLVGTLVALAIFLLHHGRYAGLGTNLIEQSLTGETIYPYDWFLKLLLTVITLAAGLQGGEVTPLFAIGASSGVVLAGLLGFPIELAAALGYIAVFSSATNTLLAPILIGIEVFGWQSAPLYLIVVGIAYFANRKHSIYSAQKNIYL